MSEINLSPPSRLEQAFVVLVLAMSTSAFLNLGNVEARMEKAASGVFVFEVIWAALFLIAAFCIWRYCRQAIAVLWRARLLMFLAILPLISVLWSDFPMVTARRGSALLATTAFGAYFGLRYRLRDQLRLLVYTCAIIIALSYIFGLLALGTAVNNQGEGWIGVFGHRGMLSRFAVFSGLVFLTYWRAVKCGAALFGLVACVGLIILATARAEMIYGSMLFWLFWMLPVLRQRWSRIITVGGILAAVPITIVIWIVQNFETFTTVIGRDPGMTGRLQLWGVSILMALQRPWFGYGYNAFWVGAEGYSSIVWKVMEWEAPHAHNGLLDLWIDLGVLGVTLFVVCYAAALARALRTYRNTSGHETAWLIMFLAFLVGCNITESTLLTGKDLFWICYVAIYVVTTQGMLRAPAAGSVAPQPATRRNYLILLPQAPRL